MKDDLCRSFIFKVKQLICVIGWLTTFSCTAILAQEPKTKKEQTTTGFMQEITEKRIHEGPQRSGEEVYQYRCMGCHGKNTQGAPMPDDQYEWSIRIRKGLEVLYKHSIEGFNNNLMPPLGGCRNCSNEEVYAAVRYMIEESGNPIPESNSTKNP